MTMAIGRVDSSQRRDDLLAAPGRLQGDGDLAAGLVEGARAAGRRPRPSPARRPRRPCAGRRGGGRATASGTCRWCRAPASHAPGGAAARRRRRCRGPAGRRPRRRPRRGRARRGRSPRAPRTPPRAARWRGRRRGPTGRGRWRRRARPVPWRPGRRGRRRGPGGRGRRCASVRVADACASAASQRPAARSAAPRTRWTSARSWGSVPRASSSVPSAAARAVCPAWAQARSSTRSAASRVSPLPARGPGWRGASADARRAVVERPLGGLQPERRRRGRCRPAAVASWAASGQRSPGSAGIGGGQTRRGRGPPAPPARPAGRRRARRRG